MIPPVSPEQLDLTWRLFNAAAELPPAERHSFLEAASDDPVIVRQVLALLEDSDEDDERPVPVARSHTQVSHYRIGERIGRGGMGEVYSARDTKLDRTVALKFLSSYELGADSVKRLIREAKAASALNHPNIVTVHEVIESESELAIVMELVDGAALRNILGSPLPLPKLIAVGRQIAEALAAAHARGIIHRDIKPENIMLREDGYVKLLDFGLARRTDVGQSSNTGMAAGTLRYMSPEQARGEKVTAASDIFSLGVVLYECAAGRHPFSGETPFETAHAILTKEPLPPSTLQSGLPPELESMVLAMLNKDARARPSAQALLGEMNLKGAAEYLRPAPRQRAQRAPFRNTKWILTAGVLVLLAIPVGLWLSVVRNPPLQLLVPVPLTSDPGIEFEPRLSPDGRRVAYTRGIAPYPDVVVQEIGSPPSSALVIARQSFSPAWSPQGDSLAVLRIRSEASSRKDVLIVSASGGTSRKIGEIDTPGALQDWVPSPYLDYSPDGRLVVAVDGWGTGAPAFLVLISTDTGDKFQLTTPGPGTPGDFSPRFSPDGRRIAFSRLRGFGSSSLQVLDLTSDRRPAGLPARIASGELWNAFPAWTPDGRRLVFAAGVMRNARLKLVRASGANRPVELPLPDSDISPLDLRPAGNAGTVRVVYARKRRNDDIFRVDLAGKDRLIANRRSSPFIASSFIDEQPLYSPDGTKIAFVSNRSGSQQLWVCRSDGAEPRQLTNLESAEILDHTWAPDSGRIAVRLALPDRAGIDEVDVIRGGTRPLVEDDAATPAYSPDGQWLYFQRRKSLPQTWRMPAQGGTLAPVHDVPPGILRFTPDGKTLASAQGLQVFVKPVSGGSSTLVFGSMLSAQSWAVTKSGIYAVVRSAPSGPWQLAVWRFADRRLVPVAAYDRTAANGISISPDERYALLTQREQHAVDLMLLDQIDLSRY